MEASHESLAAYALNALGADERRDFERHLEECERCREDLPALADAASALALAVDPVPPPPELRSRILDGARRGGEVVPLRRRVPAAVAVVAAVAASAAIGLGIWALTLHDSLSSEREALSAQNAALAVLSDPSARRVSLSGRSGVLAVRTDGTAALAVRGLERAPQGKTYEAWIIQSDTPRPAGLFTSRAKPVTLFVLEGRVPRGAAVAVTVERAAGVQRPTTTPILSARA